MSGPLSETAYAKINLALHVRARRPDGYHEIETLFAFAEDGDVLEANPSRGLSLDIVGPFARDLPGKDNLVMRAADALGKATGHPGGAALRLTKNLPVASGIGGGSADAAATLRLLCALWNVAPSPTELRRLASGLGADVPACLASTTVVGTGRGDDLTPAQSGLEGDAVLLVNPLKSLATGPVFQAWDGKDRGPLNAGEILSWRNDLVAPAISLVPEIEDVLERFKDYPGIKWFSMSGSGATCFAVFESTTTRDSVAGAFPDCWTLATRLRSS